MGEHSKGSHHEIDRAEDSPETSNQQKEKGEDETIWNILMGCLVGDITRGSPTLEVKQGF